MARVRVTLAGDVGGLHARPAGYVIEVLTGVDSAFVFRRGGTEFRVASDSVLDLLAAAGALELEHGSTFDIVCEGPDETEALSRLERAFTTGPFEGSSFRVLEAPGLEATVLLVEDEIGLLENVVRALRRRGHNVQAASRPDDALRAIRQAGRIDVAVIDLKLPMEGSQEVGLLESAGGMQAGLVLGRELRHKFSDVPVIFWTDSTDREVRYRVRQMGNSRFIPKTVGLDAILEIVEEALHGGGVGAYPRSFIVHGHDEPTMQSVKRYITDTLGFPEPIVLRDTPSFGRTIIEKLESHTYSVDMVFVLLTPDDRVFDSDEPAGEAFRSRQNVIFELGYFLGALGRSTGRVLLLYRQPIQLPSDIWGIVAIDITDGIESAETAIRQELKEWL